MSWRVIRYPFRVPYPITKKARLQSPGRREDPETTNWREIEKWAKHVDEKFLIETRHLVGGTDEPAFQNSWANVGDPDATCRFWVDPFRMVWIQGVVHAGTPGSSSVVFTLPTGYIPAQTHRFVSLCDASTGGFQTGQTTIQTDGDVVAVRYLGGGSGSADEWDFGLIGFRLDNPE